MIFFPNPTLDFPHPSALLRAFIICMEEEDPTSFKRQMTKGEKEGEKERVGRKRKLATIYIYSLAKVSLTLSLGGALMR